MEKAALVGGLFISWTRAKRWWLGVRDAKGPERPPRRDNRRDALLNGRSKATLRRVRVRPNVC